MFYISVICCFQYWLSSTKVEGIEYSQSPFICYISLYHRSGRANCDRYCLTVQLNGMDVLLCTVSIISHYEWRWQCSLSLCRKCRKFLTHQLFRAISSAAFKLLLNVVRSLLRDFTCHLFLNVVDFFLAVFISMEFNCIESKRWKVFVLTMEFCLSAQEVFVWTLINFQHAWSMPCIHLIWYVRQSKSQFYSMKFI